MFFSFQILFILVVLPCLVVKSWISVIPNAHIFVDQLFATDTYIFSHLSTVNLDVASFALDPSIILPNNIDPLKTVETFITTSIQTINPNVISNQIGNNINNALQSVGESTLTGFNNILDENPKLKLSTSEFVMDYYTNTFLPKYTYTTGVISNGPLAQGIKNLVSQSPNDLVEAAATKAYTILDTSVKPISVNIISGITTPVTQVVVGTANNVLNTIDGVVTYIQNDGIKQSISVAGGGSSSIDLDTIRSSIITIPSLSIPVDIVDNSVSLISSFINTIPTALNKASTSFSTQLAQKGTILASNTASLTNSLSTSIPKLVVNSWNSAGDVLIEKVNTIPTTILIPIKKTAISSLESLGNIVNAYSNKIASTSNWKLFADENHWQNGFWEQQFTGIQRIIKDLTIQDDDATTQQIRNQYISRISDSLSNFDDRFVAQYTAKRNEYKDFDTKIINFGSNILHIFKSFTDKSIDILYNVKKETELLIQDTKSYVDEFIISGNEL